VNENRKLRRIFVPKRWRATAGLRKLHYEDLHKLYYSSDIIKVVILRVSRVAQSV
jgi:hypothetical protein